MQAIRPNLYFMASGGAVTVEKLGRFHVSRRYFWYASASRVGYHGPGPIFSNDDMIMCSIRAPQR